MTKWIIRIALLLVASFLAAFWQLFLSARPPLTTDPATLAGDGSTIDYCDLPVLDGSGKRAADIPKGNTPDFGPNSTRGENTNDTEGAVLFRIGDREYCPRTSASMIWNDGILDFQVFGWGPVVVQRYLDGKQLVWEYADGSITRLNRICALPESVKIPEPRGRRISLF